MTLTERQFQTQVVNLAKHYGWNLIYHTFNSQRSQPGFPDLVLVRPPEILFVELKTETGKIRPAQAEWLKALDACGLEAYLWRPSDFDELNARLARGRAKTNPLYRAEEAA